MYAGQPAVPRSSHREPNRTAMESALSEPTGEIGHECCAPGLGIGNVRRDPIIELSLACADHHV